MLLSTPSRRCGQIMPRVCTAVRSFQILFLKIRKNGTGAESGLPPSAPCLFRCNGRIKRRKVHCRGCVKKETASGDFFIRSDAVFIYCFQLFPKTEMIVFLAEMLFIPGEDTIYTWQEAITPLRGTLLPRRDTFTSGRCPREPCWAHTSPSWLPGRRPCQIRVPPRRPRTESSHWSQYHTSCRRRQNGCHQRK